MEYRLFDHINIEKNGTPIYRQLAESLKDTIMSSVLAPGDRLPSLNAFAEALGINRLTVLRALEELEIEGWINKKEKSGVFVAEELPEYRPAALRDREMELTELQSIPDAEVTISAQDYSVLSFNEGYPDHRFFPTLAVTRAFSTVLKDQFSKQTLSYHDVFGHDALRQTISRYCHRTRGIPNGIRNVIITRGSTMGIYLAGKSVCVPGEIVAMGKPGYYLARECFVNQGLEVVHIESDDEGIDIDALKALLRKRIIKLLYTTPHHNYPTTVTMPAERRLELLKLAAEYGFYILEDDYDFDFQYDRSPILPMASLDQLRSVIYIGGFSKSLSPALRIGFMLAGENIIWEAGKWRKLIDRQGDTVQELAFNKLLEQGIIEGTIRKARKAYAQRRDFAYGLINAYLGNLFSPEFPGGGLAFWTRVHLARDTYARFRNKAFDKGVFLVDSNKFQTNCKHFTRLGFASMNEKEIEKAVGMLKLAFYNNSIAMKTLNE